MPGGRLWLVQALRRGGNAHELSIRWNLFIFIRQLTATSSACVVLQARNAQERARAAAAAEAADHGAEGTAGLLAPAAGAAGGAAEGGAAGEAAEGEGPQRPLTPPPLHAGVGSRHGVYEPLLTAEHVV